MSRINSTLQNIRSKYFFEKLDEKKMLANPISQFELWMQLALQAKAIEPNAMTLATVDSEGFPDARIVLLREVNKKGFSFFTNYKSKKGKEISGSKKVCLNFFWAEIIKQVRITGTVEKLSSKPSDEYFASRPRDSQIAAWASQQSESVESRAMLEERFAYFEKRFEGKKIPRPPHWGGYVVVPKRIEFWQGQLNRLHDRIVYTKLKNGKWKMERLMP